MPKWDKAQFQARQTKMSKPEKRESIDEKYKDIDNTLKAIDKQLKEGHNLETGERGKNKVASLAASLGKKEDTQEAQNQQKQVSLLVTKIKILRIYWFLIFLEIWIDIIISRGIRILPFL